MAITKKKLDALAEPLPWFIREYYQSKLSLQYSLRTLNSYFCEYKLFFNYMIENDLSSAKTISDIALEELNNLRKKNVEAYFLYRQEVASTHINYNPESVVATNRYVCATLKSLFRYLSEETEDDEGKTYLIHNVMKKIRVRNRMVTMSERAYRLEKLIFTKDETHKFLQFIEEGYARYVSDNCRKRAHFEKHKERDTAILALFLGTGIRLTELVNLDIEHIDIEQQRVTVRRKGGKMDTVAIAGFALKYLKQYMLVREMKYRHAAESPALFFSTRGPIVDQTVHILVKKYTKAFNHEVSPHKLRHSLASMLYNESHSQVLVAQQLGHTDLSTVAVYAHVGSKEIMDILNRL
ncbi:MAG: tyrosine recombinase XerS [Streptococcaceae bacterium]|nr:tyrosine recombinase XerS [Streptococcaceae bacterium]